MTDRIALPAAQSSSRNAERSSARDPVREYVADLAGQLAIMARTAGDEALAQTLEVAADLAMLPLAHPVMVAAPLKRSA